MRGRGGQGRERGAAATGGGAHAAQTKRAPRIQATEQQLGWQADGGGARGSSVGGCRVRFERGGWANATIKASKRLPTTAGTATRSMWLTGPVPACRALQSCRRLHSE